MREVGKISSKNTLTHRRSRYITSYKSLLKIVVQVNFLFQDMVFYETFIVVNVPEII